MKISHKYFRLTGYTLIELMVVVAIISVLMLASAVVFRNFQKRNKLLNSAKMLSDTINYANSYSQFFKKKTAVKFSNANNNLTAFVIAYKNETDTILLNTVNLGNELTVYPLNSGGAAKLSG